MSQGAVPFSAYALQADSQFLRLHASGFDERASISPANRSVFDRLAGLDSIKSQAVRLSREIFRDGLPQGIYASVIGSPAKAAALQEI
ncbi:MAG: hypothetical protein C4519_02620 [Desulfobacteraceae bacterium]|nr:MAG: hypothetical protein C4519_02620 [Desulfobacteraceae bacterium]